MNGIGPASLLILAANIGLGLYGLYSNPQLIEKLLFRPYEFARGRRRFTALTSGFVHADLPHLIFNMLTYWFFGIALERFMGTPKFVVFYVLALLVSLVGTLRKHRNNPQYGTLGASGAISAVLFAAIVYAPESKLMILPLPVPIPAPLFALGYLGYSYWSAKTNRGNINHDAHLGGAIFGLLFVAVTEPAAYGRALELLRG